jgi:D-alanyl-D-alanine carboxypeptidase/D-alanyl-D-alanine-endopeptidase (penicillin-binding protein 4)
VDINAETMLVPASNMKLISTGIALHKLGADYRFETAIGHDGTIEDGVLKGNLYIIGGGDPTLGSKDSIAVSLEKVFGQWESMVRQSGIRKIEGRIIGDGRAFDGMMEEPTWLWNDIGTYYGAGTTGLMFYENMQSFSVAAGDRIGDPVKISPSYPQAPWMEFRYNCTTGENGTGDLLYMYTSDLAPVAEIRGTYGLDRGKKRLDCSNKFPEYTCAHYFMNHLKKKGIQSGGAGDFRLDTAWEQHGEIHILGKTYSPTLARIAFETNHASNNLYAETLLRQLGKGKTGSACYDSSYVALNDVLAGMKLDMKSIEIADGSGLSRKNIVSAEFMCRFLEAMMHSPCFEEYAGTLPSPGSHGTLAGNMSKSPAEVKERIKVKSGSMSGVRCYSGYVIPTEGSKDDTIIFSIMVNNCTSPSWKVRQLLDKIMAAFAAAN